MAGKISPSYLKWDLSRLAEAHLSSEEKENLKGIFPLPVTNMILLVETGLSGKLCRINLSAEATSVIPVTIQQPVL